MAGRQITRVAAAIDEYLSLTGCQRLYDDLRVVRLIGIATIQKREEDTPIAGKYLRSIGDLIVFERHEPFRCASVGRKPDNSTVNLPEYNPPAGPTQAECAGQCAD